MFLPLLRLWVRIASRFFFYKIEVSGKENLPADCPVLFAANHPNSFLDSLVMTITVGRPLYYTAKGDIFNSKFISAILSYLQVLPMFRMEEGKENLHKNDITFSSCLEVWKKKGAVSIFSEGNCENEWDLRPLRKGTARLAYEAWNSPNIGDNLKIVPVAINYSSWHKTGPKIYISYLKNMEKDSFEGLDAGQFNKKFNDELKSILSEKCIVVDKGRDLPSQHKITGFVLKNFPDGLTFVKQIQDNYQLEGNKTFKANHKSLADFLIKENLDYYKESKVRIISFILSVLVFLTGYTLNALPYFISKFIAKKSTKDRMYYDSILFLSLMVIYPLYLLTIFYLIFSLANSQVLLALGSSLVAILTALFHENSKRTIQCFMKSSKLKAVGEMLLNLRVPRKL